MDRAWTCMYWNLQFGNRQGHQGHCWLLSTISICEAFHSCQGLLELHQRTALLCRGSLLHRHTTVFFIKHQNRHIITHTMPHRKCSQNFYWERDQMTSIECRDLVLRNNPRLNAYLYYNIKAICLPPLQHQGMKLILLLFQLGRLKESTKPCP